jgi:hypothetical protein
MTNPSDKSQRSDKTIDKSLETSFPLYKMSKVLGKGACGEVRLGFRVPDLHRVAIKIFCKRTTINLEDVIDMPNFLFIVLELLRAGSCLTRYSRRRS